MKGARSHEQCATFRDSELATVADRDPSQNCAILGRFVRVPASADKANHAIAYLPRAPALLANVS